MQFRVFKKGNITQGISEVSFGSIKPTANKFQSEKRAVQFLKSIGQQNVLSQNLVWAEEIFSSNIYICKPEDSGRIIKNVDGLISNVPGQILAITTGDCVPILFFDPENRIVSILHGGRKCLVKGIIKNMIKKMAQRFRSSPEKILVGIGPHIRACHYWLKEKDYQTLKNTKFKKYFIPRNKKTYFDLTKLTFDELLRSGIKRKNIEDCKICTFCQYRRYFSQRKKEEDSKVYKKRYVRFASFIGLKEMEILKISSRNFKNILGKVAKSIKQGKVIICPTDTVYGLITDATNKEAVKKLLKIKRRPQGKAIPIFVKDLKITKKFAFVNEKQEKFFKKIWPGKITVILKRKKTKIKLYGVDKKTIGLRIPKYKFLNALLQKLNLPLTGTSANISGKPASGNIKEVLSQFKDKKHQPDFVIDVGNLPKSKPSVVLDLTSWPPKILRS